MSRMDGEQWGLRAWQPMNLIETFLFGPDDGPDVCVLCGRLMDVDDEDVFLCRHCASLPLEERLAQWYEDLCDAEDHAGEWCGCENLCACGIDPVAMFSDEHGNLVLQGEINVRLQLARLAVVRIMGKVLTTEEKNEKIERRG